MPSIVKVGNEVVLFVVTIGAGLGLALYLLSTFQTAIGVNTAGAAVGNIVTGTSIAISNVVIPLISVIFVLGLYAIAKQYGIIGGHSGE